MDALLVLVVLAILPTLASVVGPAIQRPGQCSQRSKYASHLG